jgi:aminoglycoside N3'-acetyltransferase
MVDKDDIVSGLRSLNIVPGSRIMVHSSLSSFGCVQGGAQTVIAALMEVITSEGTLMLPSFNHGEPFEKCGPGYYHPEKTPTTNGAIPDLFWRLPGVYRSLDPTHPFSAWGSNARQYVEFHHRTLTMGPQSPLGLLCADGGYGLLLGVNYGANTFHHVVEMSTGAPCLGLRTEAYPVVLPDGRIVQGRTWGWRSKPCPLTDNTLYQEEMEAQALQKIIMIGESRIILYCLQDCYTVIARMLQDGKNGFPPCKACPIRPRRTRWNVTSDWDSQTQNLKPESIAWSY